MAKVKISRGLQANYNAIPVKDGDTIYVCTDTGHCYLGDILLSPAAILSVASGLRIYYNGADVTDDATMQQTIANVTKRWFGSISQYAKLVHDNQVEQGVAYHLIPNPDWEESDEESLAYIKNKPTILDVTVLNGNVNTNKIMKLFYK